eukprot:CAMPEP_0167769466 /NCGR_PEP_ID=MMETSP0110_2-20121227/17318_1 /TAXON_ID=629695 /ORGANISM="Gymnochlora sp., Strain CCMP2014" /LENGTH=130 /DNA_ID=CAMNT_0007658413 /DNA_START=400 /DNA_END=788 /DNA_ORIENTATION=-
MRGKVAHITSEDSPGYKLFRDTCSIYEAISGSMPANLSTAEKKARTISWLKASGLQLHDRRGKPIGNAIKYVEEKFPISFCSGGQRHLIYVLSMLASEPEVVLADEILVGLDVQTQARVLVMLQYLSVVR